MASAPRFRRLAIEDFKEAPGWLMPLLQQLNEALSPLIDALARRLTRTENFRSTVKAVEVVTPAVVGNAFPLSVKPDEGMGGISPKLCWIGKVELLKGSVLPTTACWLNWDLDGEGNVRMLHVSGLTANQRYRVWLVME